MEGIKKHISRALTDEGFFNNILEFNGPSENQPFSWEEFLSTSRSTEEEIIKLLGENNIIKPKSEEELKAKFNEFSKANPGTLNRDEFGKFLIEDYQAIMKLLN